MRVHQRKDFTYRVVKGKGGVSGLPAYACVIIGKAAKGFPYTHHIQLFFSGEEVPHGGNFDARKLRAMAMRYGRAVVSGKRCACAVDGYARNDWPSSIPQPKDIPPFLKDVRVEDIEAWAKATGSTAPW